MIIICGPVVDVGKYLRHLRVPQKYVVSVINGMVNTMIETIINKTDEAMLKVIDGCYKNGETQLAVQLSMNYMRFKYEETYRLRGDETGCYQSCQS